MFNARNQIRQRSAIGAQLVDDDDPRLTPSFEKLAEKVLCSRFVAPGLQQNVENIPL